MSKVDYIIPLSLTGPLLDLTMSNVDYIFPLSLTGLLLDLTE
jgi:hypothetical protein